MKSGFQSCLLMFVLVLVGMVTPAFAGEIAEGARAPRNAADDSRIAGVMRELASANWRTREAAAFELMDRGPAVYEALRREYRETSSYDVRRRIRVVAREIRVTELLGPSDAFLGVRLPQGGWQPDLRIAPGRQFIVLHAIVPGSAAERAGLEAGDIIVSIDGKPLGSDETWPGLSGWIRGQAPGTLCRLGVIRGGEGHVRRLAANEADGPADVAGLKTRIVGSGTDARLESGTAAIEILETAEALGLESGDLIIALDGAALSADSAAAMFLLWSKQARPTASEGPEQGQNNVAGANPDKSAPSIQVLRGGRWMEFDVVLGQWRAYGPDGIPLREGVTEAEIQFEEWWRETFSPEREASDRFGADAFWKMEP